MMMPVLGHAASTIRRAAPAPLALALALGAALVAGAPAAAGPQGTDARAADAGPVRVLAPSAMRAPAAQPAPGVSDIELQTFDGDAFPPEGWRTVDNAAAGGQRQETYLWGLADCEFPRTAGNVHSAWSVGGGRLGDALLCGAEYAEPVESWLVRDDIDATDLDGGLSVSLNVFFDAPAWVERSPGDPAYVPPPLRVCGSAAVSGGVRNFRCIRLTNPPGTEKQWLGTNDDPLKLPWTAGQPDAAVAIIYTDPEPDALYSGVFVDNVLIQGLSSAVGPTATNAPPSATPSGPRPTAGPTMTSAPISPRDARKAFLPIAARAADLALMAPGGVPTRLPGWVEVTFGTNVDVTGQLENPGTRFDHGITRLCSKVAWHDLPIGTRVRSRWHQLDARGVAYEPIPGTVEREEHATSEEGFVSQCIRYELDGAAVPVPANRYKVYVKLRDDEVPSASGMVEVVDGAGPRPTAGPTATPKPLPAGCNDPLINGDFELGPGEGWISRTPSGEPIIRDEVAFEGTYSAIMGRHLGRQESLASTVLVETVPAARIEKAELTFVLGVVTDETRGDGVNSDVFGFGVLNEALTIDIVGAVSEESFEPRAWNRLRVDMTESIVNRPDYERVVLAFVTEQSAERITNFIVDNVALEICLTSGEILRVPLDAARGAGAVAPLTVTRAALEGALGRPAAWRAAPAPAGGALLRGWRASRAR